MLLSHDFLFHIHLRYVTKIVDLERSNEKMVVQITLISLIFGLLKQGSACIPNNSMMLSIIEGYNQNERLLFTSKSSTVGKQVKIFIIFIFTAKSFAQIFVTFDKFDTAYPFNHLISKLILNPEP